MENGNAIERALVTGATGFVGRNVVRALLKRGVTPVCFVRSARKLFEQHPEVNPDRLVAVSGDLGDRGALAEAAGQAQAVIHLVGIILARRLKGQTFHRIHVRGTENVLEAAGKAAIRRFVHMSALGARPDAPTAYHRTKWEAEQRVRKSGLDWTIFRPSLIHGPDGEFMRLFKQLICGLVPPLIPYFGSGEAKIQPVSVKDVAHFFAESLRRAETIGKVFELGGPKVYSWIELYNACRTHLPGARAWKPMVSQPVPVAKLMAKLTAPPMALAELVIPSLGLMRFDSGQVQMSQEDNTCDHTAAEKAFGIRMRPFEEELSAYAELIP